MTTAGTGELWWEAPDGQWYWQASDGNWYRASDHPTGVPPSALASSRAAGLPAPGAAGTSASAEAATVSPPPETVHAWVSPQPPSHSAPVDPPPEAVPVDPWEAARRDRAAMPGSSPSGGPAGSGWPAEAGGGGVAAPPGPGGGRSATDAEILPDDEGLLPPRALTSRGVAVRLGALAVSIALVVPVVIAMTTRTAAPFLTPGQQAAVQLEGLTYPSAALQAWVRTAGRSLGSIYDDYQAMENTAIEVAYTQGAKGQPSLFQGCIKLASDVQSLSKVPRAPVADVELNIAILEAEFTRVAQGCVAGLLQKDGSLLQQAAADSASAMKAWHQVQSDLQAQAVGKAAK